MGRPIAFVALAMLSGIILSATVFRDDIAKAAGLAKSAPVTVVNTSTDPVPVTERNLDANGNIKTHEQGTADVNVTNSSLPVHEQGTANVNVTNTTVPVHEQGTVTVAAPSPISQGARQAGMVGGVDLKLNSTFTASELTIDVTPGVQETQFHTSGGGVAAVFLGPGEGFAAPQHLDIALTRPISFDSIDCFGGGNDACHVSWISASP